MTILFMSTRRDGRSLGQMARDELGPFGGFAALAGTLMIMIILIAVLALVVVNAMKGSPWATFSVFATIPIALAIGVYVRSVRPGRVLEASIIGMILLLLGVAGGGWIDQSASLRGMFDYTGPQLAAFFLGCGWPAPITPVWLLLAPRGYLSTFLKLGVIALLAVSIVVIHPVLKMPALTQFTAGNGPIFAGKVFPFVFITIACGAISGFHALISSGTTPKLIGSEADVRLVGYGSMALESFVAIMAVIAATLLDPGVYFAINTGAGVVGADAHTAVATISGWGFPVTVEQMQQLAQRVGERALFARTGDGWGGAPPPPRRGAVARGGHGEHLQLDLRQQAACGVVSLRAHVRGGIHPHDHRCGDPGRPLHVAGLPRALLEAARPHLLVSVGAADECAGRRRLVLLPLRRCHRPQRRHQHPLAAVRHRESDARGHRTQCRDRDSHQEREAQVLMGDRRAARVAGDR